MAFVGISINTGVHICFPFFEEMKQCIEGHTFGRYECKEQVQDYLECHNRKKYMRNVAMMEKQLRKSKLVNVPHYDAAGDRFVFDDGKVVDNSDPIFEGFNWR